MKGVYAAFFQLKNLELVDVGALGEIEFSSGLYVYVGSAMNNVEKRINRHFSETRKKHWHIDYFSARAQPFDSLVFDEDSSYECVLADIFSCYGEPVDGFGCSDCDCNAHLFRLNSEIYQLVLDGQSSD